jgi:outer membrane protein
MRRSLPLALGLLFFCAAGVANAQQRIAIVDLQRAVEGTADGKAAVAALRAEADKKQKELEGRRDELKKASDELMKQEAVLKPEVFAQKRKELEQRALQFQESVMRAEQEIQQKQGKVLLPAQQKVMAAIAQIAARERFTLVLRADTVLWPQQSELDITNEVIRKANEAKPAK